MEYTKENLIDEITEIKQFAESLYYDCFKYEERFQRVKEYTTEDIAERLDALKDEVERFYMGFF